MTRFYRFIFLLLLQLGILANTVAQSQESVIKAQALELARAISRKDAAGVEKFIYPRLAKAASGRVNMTQMMDSVSKQLEAFKPEIKRILIGNPGKIVTYKKVMQALLPQELEIKTTLFSVTLNSTLVALSEDNGKRWYFADALFYQSKEADIIKHLPALSPELVLPVTQPPKIVPVATGTDSKKQ